MFSGQKAEQLAALHGLEIVPPESMISERSRARLAAYQKYHLLLVSISCAFNLCRFSF